MIVAEAHNRVIGKSNDLPWYLPADLKRFKEITTGHAVIMGHNTYQSIMARLGKPLPNRTNIVITHADDLGPDVRVAHSPQEALWQAGKGEVFVIGGARVFADMLALTDKIYLTQVDVEVDGDTFFPELSDSEWREAAREHHGADEKNQYDYDFVVMERIR